MDFFEDVDFFINVIFKLGMIIEFVIVFCIFCKFFEEKYGKEEVKVWIYVIIDKECGVLKMLFNEEGFELFVIFDDVGGCYFVLIVVGFLLIVVSGVNIDDMMKGVLDVSKDFVIFELEENFVY